MPLPSCSHNIPDPEVSDDVFFCRHCKEVIPILDNVPLHACFVGKEVFLKGDQELYSPEVNEPRSCTDNPSKNAIVDYMEGNEENCNGENNLLLKNKQAAAIWTNNATLALLALYEAKVGMLEHPKKKTKIWLAIADGLRDFDIEMSPQQVRWKMNALTKRYKECIDNNNKTGRGTVEFEWFEQLDDIFNTNKINTAPAYTVSSKLCSLPATISKSDGSNVIANKKIEEKGKNKKKHTEKNDEYTVLNEICQSSDTATNKQITEGITSPRMDILKNGREKRAKHGTGSSIAKSKIELGKQWHQHLEDKAKREVIKEKRYDDMLKKKEELLQLKKKQIELKEKELQQKKSIVNIRMKAKEKRHDEVLSLEREKYKLLRVFLKKDTGNTSSKHSDSSD